MDSFTQNKHTQLVSHEKRVISFYRENDNGDVLNAYPLLSRAATNECRRVPASLGAQGNNETVCAISTRNQTFIRSV